MITPYIYIYKYITCLYERTKREMKIILNAKYHYYYSYQLILCTAIRERFSAMMMRKTMNWLRV